ncbi:endoribonuclease Dicer-like [Ruditapes philippinarum]|uniref:endoribonuclease Dicer-like n=1 Tax=Ruditapes philippinarum TaxID=129788 RepID=UPI00295B89A5|nr:endoribonuclease Dicer-like [Ruditapes philippinarum]
MAYTRRMGSRSTSKRLPRHLRNEDIPRDTFTPRTYQVELLDSALERNTVVCMGSSTGRMFIAVMLMKEMAEDIRKPLTEDGKRTFFIVDTDDNVRYRNVAVQHQVNFTVKAYTEEDGISEWSNETWRSEITRSEAFILTGTEFLRLLKEGIVTMEIINLLVLDNCHLVLKPHPYIDIMEIYKSANESHRPRILGLTSNILDGKFQNPELLSNLIDSLEKSLLSVAETSSLVIPERYGIKPTERIIECNDYEDTTGLNVELYNILENAIEFLEECNIVINEDLDNRDPCLIAKAALIECHNILSQLGPWCAACLADLLVTQIEKIEKQKEFVPMHKKFLKIGATNLRMVSKVFEEHFKQCEYSLDDLLTYTTPKVAELMDSLRKYKPQTDFVIISEDLDSDGEVNLGSDTDMSDDSDFSENDEEDDGGNRSPSSKQIHVAIKKVSPEDENKSDPFSLEEERNLCGIVFVNHQHEAYALNKFIEEACAWDEGLCFVKSSHLTGNKSTKKEKLYKKQEDTLRKFRMQELNLLVSTNVLEEGVDVPKCNFVVRFDVPKTYKSYSHSKGRARSRDAEYIILIEGEHYDQFMSELKTYHQIEKVLIRRSGRIPEKEASQDSGCESDTLVEPFIPAGGWSDVKVTLDSSIMLVNRYCAKLPSDAFTHLTPACTVTETEQDGKKMFIASLRLPINSPVKEIVQGVPMGTKLKAKQAVALKMCKILHKQGELDDNLMPVGKEMFERDEDDDIWDEEEDQLGEARPGTTKRKQYYCKKVATALQQTVPVEDTACYLYIIDMVLTGPITEDQNTRGRKLNAPEDTPRCFGILTTKTIPLVPMFPVFTRSGEVTVSINILSREVALKKEELDKLKIFHMFLFSNVLRLEKDPMDFFPDCSTMGFLVVPLNKEDGVDAIHVDWQFTEKVVEASNNPLKRQPEEEFVFHAEDFEDAVVMPSYRNIDQPQYFYVAEIRSDLNPVSPFPSPELYKTFKDYYSAKYGLKITNTEQPLLDVDHTSARLNLLIPRYMNQKGVPLPTSSAETKKARRENLQQKQILVPELCDIHVFLASLWRKAVCLPAILYRVNYLLLGEEIRKHIATETKIGISELPVDYRFPKLDFGIDTSPEHLKPLTDNTDTNFKTVDDEAKESENEEEWNARDLAQNDNKDDVINLNGSKEKEKNDNQVTETAEGIDSKSETCICGLGVNNISAKTDTDDKSIDTLTVDIGEKCNLKNLEDSSDKDQGLTRSHDEITRCNKCSKSAIDITEADCDSVCETANKLDTFQTVKEDSVFKADCKTAAGEEIRKDNISESLDPESKIEDECHEKQSMLNGLVNDGKTRVSDQTLRENDKCLGNEMNEKLCKNRLNGLNGLIDSAKPKIENGAIETECRTTEISCDTVKTQIVKDESLDTSILYYLSLGLEFPNQLRYMYPVNFEIAEEVDVFANIEKFVIEKKETDAEEETCPEPLISLDEDMDLSTFIGPSPCEILQALTMSNANDFFSLERLETIGDSFLKYAITVYLYCSYPGIHEGKLSYLRSKQVSNYNLYRLGKRKGLAECMISTKFEPYENWLPPGYVINDDKRKGPVPKVYVAPLSIHKTASTVFSSQKLFDTQNGISDDLKRKNSEVDLELKKFLTELDEADQISKAKDEEFLKGDKSEVQLSFIPYSLQLHHCLPDKSIADCMEALIGCYLTSCDKMAALRLMSWMGLKVLPKKKRIEGENVELNDVEFDSLSCPLSPFLRTSPDADNILHDLLDGYKGFEKKIGYTFCDRSYLLQAFTHASYHFNTVTDCYQRLEFLGDAVLDYVITRHLYEDSDKYSPGVLTDLRSALVNNNIFAALAVKWDFHKYFKAISPSLFHVIEKFVSRQKEKEDEIDDENDETDEDHEKEHVELEVPKALGDIFESVAGAIYLDSKMSLDTVWRVFYRIMKPQIDKYLKNIPKSPVRELLEQEPETAKFEKPERTMDGKIRVTVNVVGKGVFTGVGRNYRIAKSAAAKKALRCIKTLEQQGLI